MLNMLLASLAPLLLTGAVHAVFEDASVFNKVVGVSPACKLSVRYSDGEVVDGGNELGALATVFSPNVTFPDNLSNRKKTLLLLSTNTSTGSTVCPPDTQFLLWLIINIPGRDAADGDTEALYLPPVKIPPVISGGDRIIFLGFTQPQEIPQTGLLDYALRNCFDTKAFLRDHNLTPPYCAEYFTTSGTV